MVTKPGAAGTGRNATIPLAEIREARPRRVHQVPLGAAVREIRRGGIRRANLGRGMAHVRHQAAGPERRTSSSNRVVLAPRRLENTAEVPLTTGHAFCAAHGLGRIDFLEIDTEGFDLEVLRGFGPLFREGRVDCVQAESGLTPGNRVHLPLAEILAYMTGLGYGFHGLYGASRRDHLGGRVMRRLFCGNAAFVREPDGPPGGQG